MNTHQIYIYIYIYMLNKYVSFSRYLREAPFPTVSCRKQNKYRQRLKKRSIKCRWHLKGLTREAHSRSYWVIEYTLHKYRFTWPINDRVQLVQPCTLKGQNDRSVLKRGVCSTYGIFSATTTRTSWRHSHRERSRTPSKSIVFTTDILWQPYWACVRTSNPREKRDVCLFVCFFF